MLLCRLLCRRIFGMDVLTMSGTVTGNMTPPRTVRRDGLLPHARAIQRHLTVYPFALLSISIMLRLFHFFSSPVHYQIFLTF